MVISLAEECPKSPNHRHWLIYPNPELTVHTPPEWGTPKVVDEVYCKHCMKSEPYRIKVEVTGPFSIHPRKAKPSHHGPQGQVGRPKGR